MAFKEHSLRATVGPRTVFIWTIPMGAQHRLICKALGMELEKTWWISSVLSLQAIRVLL